ncbi:hypothetical protein [Cohnella nanjingensis]|uniref:Uncharacterized protein n=1 Tax=Cohnella nanjingensis TaxID=1387779 RepID=A0A7X0RX94_9BACL|nr:hypothetical protein [Cohnella nanjingensis]MBB6675328.1 hypothetical protein [Cohnella nanjingensis]
MRAFLGFMFFSTFEGIAAFSISMYIFRINLIRYGWQVLTVIGLINLQNYFIREEFLLSSVAPVINILLTAFFLNLVVRIPIIWSTILSVVGFVGIAVIQSGIIFFSQGYFSLDEAQVHLWKQYSVQCITGVIGFSVGWVLYKFGYGFSFDFDKLRLKWEHMAVLSLIAIFIVTIGVMMYFREVFLNLLVFVFAMLAILIYSFKKEDAEE